MKKPKAPNQYVIVAILIISFVAVLSVLALINFFFPGPPPAKLVIGRHLPSMVEVCQKVERKAALSEEQKQQIEAKLVDNLAKHSITSKQRDDLLAELERDDASVEYLQCILSYQIMNGSMVRQTAYSILKP